MEAQLTVFKVKKEEIFGFKQRRSFLFVSLVLRVFLIIFCSQITIVENGQLKGENMRNFYQISYNM